jgi:hypothetical protein
MATLDRFVLVRLSKQTVTFKYKKPMEGDNKDWVVVDLEKNDDIRIGMISAFLRARDATVKASGAFGKLKTKSGAISGASKVVSGVLDAHFKGASAASQLDKIQTSFAAIAKGLSEDVVISDTIGRPGKEVEGCVDPKRAVGGEEFMVAVLKPVVDPFIDKLKVEQDQIKQFKLTDEMKYAKGVEMARVLTELGPANLKSIHVLFNLCISRSVDFIARVIVHEAAHKFAGAGDVSYMHEGSFRSMNADQAILNADSYAYAALSVLRGEVMKDTQFYRSEPIASTIQGKVPKKLDKKAAFGQINPGYQKTPVFSGTNPLYKGL